MYSQKTAGGKRFSKIDFKNAYLEMEVEASKQYLTINSHNVLLRYDRLPFGIKTAHSIGRGQWNKPCKEGIPNIDVMLQDSIVTRKSDAAHLENENIEAVLKILEFCGHEID